MAAFKEKNIWAKLKAAFQNQPLVTKAERIETKWAGFPDVLYIRNNNQISLTAHTTGFIELKKSDAVRGKNKSFKITLKKEQCLWLSEHSRLGGECYILVQFGNKGAYILISGEHAMRFNKSIQWDELDNIVLLSSNKISDIVNFIVN